MLNKDNPSLKKMSNKIITPNKKRINDEEEVAIPFVKCCVCGSPTTKGLHQIRLIMVKPARMQKNKYTGNVRRIPPVMKREDVYMCINCVEKKKLWPGKKPT